MADGKSRKPGKSILEKRKLKRQMRTARDADRRRRDLMAPTVGR